MRTLRAVGLALLVPGGLAAQQSAPLTKAELVRRLAADTYRASEVVEMVRRNCLSFDPTSRDRADFRRLGAPDELFRAIDACTSRSELAAASRSRPTAAAPPEPLALALEPARLAVGAGGEALVTVVATRGGRPVSELRVALEGSDPIAGGVGTVSGITDSRGRAVLNILAGPVARGYRLQVAARGVAVADAPTLLLEVLPGLPASASLSPPRVRIHPERDSTVRVRASVHDAFGNPVPGRRLSLRDPAAGGGETATAVTGPRGEADLVLDAAGLRNGGVLLLATADHLLAELPVEVAGVGPAAAGEVGPDASPAELVRAASSREDPAEAAALYERAMTARPDDVELRLSLARTLERAGRRRDAERAYREVLAREPERRDAARELALLRSRPHRLEVSAWGGALLEGSADLALQGAEISLFPTRAVGVSARYDRSLGLEGPPLLRGRDQFEGWLGGLVALWGPGGRFASRLELGRRRDETADLDQNVIRLEQVARVPAGRSYVGITVGGYLGRWFDRDDWMAYGRLRLPVGDWWSLEPTLFMGETVGTHTAVTGRSAEREVRFLLPLGYRHPAGWTVEPGLGIGNAEGDSEAASGRLLEARLLLEAPIAGDSRFRALLLHHSAAGDEPFRLATAGLALRVP